MDTFLDLIAGTGIAIGVLSFGSACNGYLSAKVLRKKADKYHNMNFNGKGQYSLVYLGKADTVFDDAKNMFKVSIVSFIITMLALFASSL